MCNLISVVVPLYNKAQYIEETINSVLKNTEYLLEIIVVDDGSTDDGANIVMAMASPFIRLISQDNGGVSKARNRGIIEAKGTLIAFLDADDMFQPLYLKEIVEMYNKYPQAAAFTTSYSYLINGALVEPIFSRSLPQHGFCGLVSDFHAWGSKASFFYTSSTCVNRKTLIQKKFFFPEGEQLGEDIDVWLRIAEQGEIVFLRKSLVVYRLEAQNSLSLNNRKDQILPCYKRLIIRLEQGLIPYPLQKGVKRVYANQIMLIAHNAASKGKLRDAFSWMFKKYAFNARYYWVKTALYICRMAIYHGANYLLK